MEDLREERAAVADAVEELGTEPVWFETFGGRDSDAEDAYLAEVRTSTVYVGILGKRYGKLLPTRFSATHAEFNEAERSGLRISAWVRREGDWDGHQERIVEEVRTFHTSYGVAPLGLVVVAVAVARRRMRPLLVAGAGVFLVAATFAVFGFWWPEGLKATIDRYEAGIAARRPYGFFLLNNLAAFAVALGPAIVVALTRLRDRRLWVVAGAALVAIAGSDLSGLSKGEVERIWLPFVPWVAVASAALAHCSS